MSPTRQSSTFSCYYSKQGDERFVFSHLFLALSFAATELEEGSSSGIASREPRAYGRGTKTHALHPVIGTVVAKIPPSWPYCSSRVRALLPDRGHT